MKFSTLQTRGSFIFFNFLMIAFFFAGCSAEFGLTALTNPKVDEASDPNDSPDPTEEPPNEEPVAQVPPPANGPLVCDPFAAGNSVGPEFGLRGGLYSDQSQGTMAGNLRATTSAHYIDPNFKVADLELKDLNVWGRQFTLGFSSSTGTPLTTLVNGVEVRLEEWFGFYQETKITLIEGVDQPGKYQFAIISDDGSSMRIKQNAQETSYTDFIVNEGLHPQKLKVSTSVLNFETGTEKFPAYISYFQGPRTHIAMQLFFRKVANDSAAALDEPLNGTTGNDIFWNTTVNPAPSTPTALYNQFLGRGWKVLERGNYMLQSGYNRCDLL